MTGVPSKTASVNLLDYLISSEYYDECPRSNSIYKPPEPPDFIRVI
jgi:hypothetical protein